MKCKTVIELLAVPSEEYPGQWRCRACGASGQGPAIKRCPRCEEPVGQKAGRMPAGTVLEFRQAWRIVRRGAAVPADEECERAAGMDPTAMVAAQRAQLRAQLGIHPDDFEDFDAGRMTGYDKQGKPIPGPNAEPEDFDEDEEDDDDEE